MTAIYGDGDRRGVKVTQGYDDDLNEDLVKEKQQQERRAGDRRRWQLKREDCNVAGNGSLELSEGD